MLKNVQIIFMCSNVLAKHSISTNHENYITRHILKMAAAQASKRRFATVTLVDKYKALKGIDGGRSCEVTAKKYGVAKDAVSHWLKKKTEIFEAVERNNVSKKRKRIKTATYEELDSAMYKWLKTARHNNIPINCTIFKEKALEFAKSLEIQDFHASDGWVGRWKKRFNVSFKTVSSN